MIIISSSRINWIILPYLTSYVPPHGNLYLNHIYIESCLPPFACVSFIPSICLHMLCFLSNLSNEACVDNIVHHVCVNFVLSLYWILCGFYLAPLRYCWTILFLGSDMLLAIHNPKMCIHMRCYHLVLIFQYYLVTMWYVMLMRNSNSTMSINFSSWILFAFC